MLEACVLSCQEGAFSSRFQCVLVSVYRHPAARMEEGLLAEKMSSLSANCSDTLWPLWSVPYPR